MKKVLIVINSMSYGGIQKALINLLQEISAKDEYEITLLMIRSKGAYIEQIPKGIKVLEANCFWKLLETSNAEIKRKNLFLWLVRGGLAVLTKNGHRKMAMRLLAASQKKLENMMWQFLLDIQILNIIFWVVVMSLC